MFEFIFKPKRIYRLGVSWLFIQYANIPILGKQYSIRIFNRCFAINNKKFKTWKF